MVHNKEKQQFYYKVISTYMHSEVALRVDMMDKGELAQSNLVSEQNSVALLLRCTERS